MSISFPPPSLLNADAVGASFTDSLDRAERYDAPYAHWTLTDIFPDEVVAALRALPFPVPALDGVSGARELHNNTRRYFDTENIAQHPVCAALAEAFQSPQLAGVIHQATGAPLEDCFLRIEFAQDADGFWLQPHTDLGVKKMTLLYYLADGEEQADLGTDIYRPDQSWAKRSSFESNSALVFVPSDITWHGFEPRTIAGVRKSVIINYVSQDWRAREQLSYPDQPIRL